MIFTIWSRSHPQNLWKLYIWSRECIDFSLVLRVTPGPNHGNHDFFHQKSRKAKRSDFGFYFVCTLYKIVSGCLSRRGLWTTSKKIFISESQLKVTYRIHCVETFFDGKPLIFCHKSMEIHENIPMFTWTELRDYWADCNVLIRDYYLRFELVHVRCITSSCD